MFSIKSVSYRGRDAHLVTGLKYYSLKDTFECGQCFRYELVAEEDGYVEYIIPVKTLVLRVGQRKHGELIIYELSEKELYEIALPFLNVDTDFERIRQDVLSRTDSEWLREAAHCARGIAILKQDEWEALFSFIVSQNNNIPRIRKIIKTLSALYGVNLTLQKGEKFCPLSKKRGTPCEELCSSCGICYTFPTADAVARDPEKMSKASVGFRYKYLLDAATKVDRSEVDLNKIAAARSYEHTRTRLKEIKGVGDKVAACAALFGFANYEAFPIDVWMKRAIDDYFSGNLDPETLGPYAGIAQQYIFHYIRNIESKDKSKSKKSK